MKTLERIMLVDDDNMDNAYHALVLRKTGAAREIVAFTSPREALEALRAGRPFDLVFLDLNMPGMNGFEFAAAAAALPEEQRPAIIMVTGSTDEQDRGRAAEFPGIRDYLTKPLTQHSVRETLGRLFAEA